jgi:hypothetical protein
MASEPVDTFEAAIADAAHLTLALNSAIAMLTFADGARTRGELERALSRCRALVERLTGSERAGALHQLGEMHAVATRLLVIAPAPSSAAIAAAEAGDPATWHSEEQAWIASRQASGSSPRLATPHRERRDTRPDSPRALRDTPDHGCEVATESSGRESDGDRAPNKAGVR